MSLLNHLKVFSLPSRRAFGCAAYTLCYFLEAAAEPGLPSAIELDPFTVVSTGTGTERLAKNLPIRTELATPDLFQATGARDLAAAIEYLPGIRSEANCQNCGTAEIKMLGLGAGYNQLLFDGQPLFSGLASVYGIEQVPTSSIGRIEVIKGGASSLYGPGAVAGVINVMPHEPVMPQQRYDLAIESVRGNPFLTASLLRDWSSPNGDTAISLYSQINDNESVDLNNDGFSDITEKRFLTLGANGWVYLKDNGKLSYNYSYSGEERRGGDRFDLLPHESQITEQLKHRWHRGGVTWESELNNDINYRLSASASYVERDSYYGGLGAVALPGQDDFSEVQYKDALQDSKLLYGYSDTMRYFFDSFFTKNLENHDLSWGIQYQMDEVFDEKRDDEGNPLLSDGTLANYSGQDPIVDGDFSNLGLYLQDEWNPNLNTTLITGIRADRHSELSDWAFSPRIALRLTSNEAWTWRTSIATGFRAPEIFDEDLHIEILDDPTRTRNTPDLVEESAVSYTAGFVWTPLTQENRFQIDAEIFRTDLQDTFQVPDIVLSDPEGNAYKERINAGDATVQGFEANARYDFTTYWSAELGLSYVDARFAEPQEVLPGIFESRYLESPEWSGVAQVNYRNDEWFDLFLGVVCTGPMIALREADDALNPSTPRFFVVDLTATKHFHLNVASKQLHIDIMAGVKNLFDERQKDLSSGPDRDTTYVYGPRFPRSFIMKTGLNW